MIDFQSHLATKPIEPEGEAAQDANLSFVGILRHKTVCNIYAISQLIPCNMNGIHGIMAVWIA